MLDAIEQINCSWERDVRDFMFQDSLSKQLTKAKSKQFLKNVAFASQNERFCDIKSCKKKTVLSEIGELFCLGEIWR